MTNGMSYIPKLKDEVIAIVSKSCADAPLLRCILPSLRGNIKAKYSNVLKEHYRLLPIHLERVSLETYYSVLNLHEKVERCQITFLPLIPSSHTILMVHLKLFLGIQEYLENIMRL